MAIYFTSDHHFGDGRLPILHRRFNSLNEYHKIVIDKWNKVVQPSDKVFYIGDFATTEEGYSFAKELNGEKEIICGNHELSHMDILPKYFKKVHSKNVLVNIVPLGSGGDNKFNLVHYPSLGVKEYFNLVGHVHTIWKLQRNMLNVGVDVNDFYPMSFKEIADYLSHMKYYDQDCFAGELEVNMCYKKIRGKEGSYADKHA